MLTGNEKIYFVSVFEIKNVSSGFNEACLMLMQLSYIQTLLRKLPKDIFPQCHTYYGYIYKYFNCNVQAVVVAEWLRRWTRNPLGSSRAGSNPADNASFFFSKLAFTHT